MFGGQLFCGIKAYLKNGTIHIQTNWHGHFLSYICIQNGEEVGLEGPIFCSIKSCNWWRYAVETWIFVGIIPSPQDVCPSWTRETSWLKRKETGLSISRKDQGTNNISLQVVGTYPSRGEGEDSLNRPGIIIYHRGKDPLEKMLFFTVHWSGVALNSEHQDPEELWHSKRCTAPIPYRNNLSSWTTRKSDHSTCLLKNTTS